MVDINNSDGDYISWFINQLTFTSLRGAPSCSPNGPDVVNGACAGSLGAVLAFRHLGRRIHLLADRLREPRKERQGGGAGNEENPPVFLGDMGLAYIIYILVLNGFDMFF